MADPVEDLCSLLVDANAKVTFDRGRDIYKPCTFCGNAPDAGGVHDLVDIGTYPNGDKLTRPCCFSCRALANARNEHPLLNLKEIERRTIARALKVAGGSVQKAAKMLGIGRATLYRRLGDYDREQRSNGGDLG